MSRRGSSEAAISIVAAFYREKTWKQADLARVCAWIAVGVTAATSLGCASRKIDFPLTAGGALGREPALIEETCRGFEALAPAQAKRDRRDDASAGGSVAQRSAAQLPEFFGPVTRRRLQTEYGQQLGTLYTSLGLTQCKAVASGIVAAQVRDKAVDAGDFAGCAAELEGVLTRPGALFDQLRAQLKNEGVDPLTLLTDPLLWASRFDLAPAFIHVVVTLAAYMDRYIQQTGNAIPYVGPLVTAVLEQVAAEAAAWVYEQILDELLAAELIGVGSAAKSACAHRKADHGVVVQRLLTRTILRLRAEQWVTEPPRSVVRTARSPLRFTEGIRYAEDYPLRAACRELREGSFNCEDTVASLTSAWEIRKPPGTLPPLALPLEPIAADREAVIDRQAARVIDAASRCSGCTFIDSITIGGAGPVYGYVFFEVFDSEEFAHVRESLNQIARDTTEIKRSVLKTEALVEGFVNCEEARDAAVRALNNRLKVDEKICEKDPDAEGYLHASRSDGGALWLRKSELCSGASLSGFIGLEGFEVGKATPTNEAEARALMDGLLKSLNEIVTTSDAKESVRIQLTGSVDDQRRAFSDKQQEQLASNRREWAVAAYDVARKGLQYVGEVDPGGRHTDTSSSQADCTRSGMTQEEQDTCRRRHRSVKFSVNIGGLFKCGRSSK